MIKKLMEQIKEYKKDTILAPIFVALEDNYGSYNSFSNGLFDR